MTVWKLMISIEKKKCNGMHLGPILLGLYICRVAFIDDGLIHQHFEFCDFKNFSFQ